VISAKKKYLKEGADTASGAGRQSKKHTIITPDQHGGEQLITSERCINIKLIKNNLPRKDKTSMQRHGAIRGKQLENAVSRTLSLLDLSFMRVSNYRCFKCGQVQNAPAKNWPDFFIYHPFLLAIECKTGSGALTSGQHEVIYKLSASGVKTLIVRDTVDLLLNYLKEKGYNI
jgi:hypothetical protein